MALVHLYPNNDISMGEVYWNLENGNDITTKSIVIRKYLVKEKDVLKKSYGVK